MDMLVLLYKLMFNMIFLRIFVSITAFLAVDDQFLAAAKRRLVNLLDGFWDDGLFQVLAALESFLLDLLNLFWYLDLL